jgi:phage shock protein A
MEPDSSAESSQSSNGQTNKPVSWPIDALLALPAEHDITGAELSESLADIINHIRRRHPQLWQQFLRDARLQLIEAEKAKTSDISEQLSVAEKLEESYQGLQNHLIQIRHAVAQAIAMEKQLEQQLQKNQDQGATWDERAKLALKQKNLELSEQAQQRGQQYIEAAKELAEQLEQQKVTTLNLRQRLTDIEGSIQKAYTRKQVLISRERAAQAHLRANELIAALDIPAVMDRLVAAEQKVVELESEVARSQTEPLPLEDQLDGDELLTQMAASLERAVKVISLLESRLDPLASQRKPDSGHVSDETES